MNWLLINQALAAIYLVGGSLVIDASENWPSRILFKFVPMVIGLPLAFHVFTQLVH